MIDMNDYIPTGCYRFNEDAVVEIEVEYYGWILLEDYLGDMYDKR